LIDPRKLTDAYVSGFFDAEGCVQVIGVECVSINFAQSGNTAILESIKNKYGCSRTNVCNGHIAFYGSEAMKIAHAIVPYSIVKKTQLESLIELHDYVFVELCEEVESRKAQLMQNISAEKHV
jgi:hypothetical protein